MIPDEIYIFNKYKINFNLINNNNHLAARFKNQKKIFIIEITEFVILLI